PLTYPSEMIAALDADIAVAETRRERRPRRFIGQARAKGGIERRHASSLLRLWPTLPASRSRRWKTHLSSPCRQLRGASAVTRVASSTAQASPSTAVHSARPSVGHAVANTSNTPTAVS